MANCTITGTLYKADGTAWAGGKFTVSRGYVGGQVLGTAAVTITADNAGAVSFTLVQGSIVTIKGAFNVGGGNDYDFTAGLQMYVPAQSSLAFTSLQTTHDALAALTTNPSAITASGYTMATSRVLGRTTAATGAIEELTASSVLDLIGSTRGQILYRGASGWAVLSPGTSGHVLQTGGAGADPSWVAGGGGGGGSVSSVFGRTGAVVAALNDYTWAQIDKATSSLADITTRSASDLSSGTLPDARFPATLPAASGVNLTALNASNLASGTVALARLSGITTTELSATAGIVSGQLATGIDAAKIGGGAVSNAEFAFLDGVTSGIQTQLDLKAPLASPAFTGSPTATRLTLTGTAGGGYVAYIAQSSPAGAPSSGFSIFADSSGRFSWVRASDGFVRKWDATLTADRTYTLPDVSGTIITSSNLSAVTTLPSLTGNGFVKTSGGVGTLSVDTSTYLTANQTISFAPTGDVTGSTTGSTSLAPALAIGATKVTSAMLNADVFSTAHSWGGQQTFTAPILGTPASATLTNATGLPIAGITGLGTGVTTALAVNVGSAGAFVTFGGALGTPSSGTLTSATGLPISTGVSGLGTGIATALAINTGSAGAPVLFNGAGGTPSSLTLTSATGLPPATGISGWPANSSGVLTNNGSGTLTWGAAGGGITIGTTTANGTAGRVLYTDGSLVQAYTVTGSGNAVLSASPSFTGIIPIASTVTTGTGTSSGFSVAADSLTTGAGANFASSSVTTGSVVNIASTSTAAASSTLKGLNIAISGANGTTAQTVTGASISVTNTNATSGTNVALTLTASGATTANTALNVTAGQMVSANAGSSSAPTFKIFDNRGIYAASGSLMVVDSNSAITAGLGWSGQALTGIISAPSGGAFAFSSSTAANGTQDLIIRRSAAANLAFGATDAASPVAQTLSVQNVVAGTSNTAGVDWTFAASRGTGTGLGGRIAWQTAPAGSTGSTQNALVEACAIESSGTFKLKTLAFSALPTAVANGEMFFCSDGAVTSGADNTLTSGGSGALAIRINGAWRAFNLQN